MLENFPSEFSLFLRMIEQNFFFSSLLKNEEKSWKVEKA